MSAKWSAQSDIANDCIDLRYSKELYGARYIAEPMLLKMKLWEPGDYTEPALVVTRQDSQSLMNALWEAGVRPRDGSGALAHVDAMKYHLEDMRKLVFERK